MRVEIDNRSGFCFGVQNAVKIAENALLNGERVFSLGPIVHNDKEVERLSDLGLISIDHNQFSELRNCKVLIRAHGEPPETYEKAERNNIEIIEATCPIVKKVQSRIRDAWISSKADNGQVVIYGKSGHAEVIGLLGQTNNEGILISSVDDLCKIDFTRPVHLFSQTTMDAKEYRKIKELIAGNMKAAASGSQEISFKIHNTVCGQVSNREPHLKEFAGNHDIIIFVSGRESSNGKMLFNVCKSVNPDTYFVSSVDEIESSWFSNKKFAGVCGATSTPKWLIEQIRDHISKL
ncbi:MAG TPA: 4-hydroxy-3-methylbut-2-enyl diphosphate reductase [Bacteroidales bacterium]|jgi:4-hydroxy-3-methylbut-2-enyl diphosphate reductase|nr:4-hydroxy-3-methylbut-2-enyl diphosphate reductase [Bacteroidales bacterium]HNR40589.1 4-hydroxy-3-methylbut-2-enyl diphosphate reductase [Bacteroidales bacterium]HPM18473.1 4-hydroxy-3-methylbut-2-enyl diphosphate reductase [Bacteroidales bacterium]HQG77314.1 4-hydroxy-3-methylbut-2-enyl diphosphate reductase [Bacteroidales bacterium]